MSLNAINVFIPPHDRSNDLFYLDLQYEIRHFCLRRRAEVLLSGDNVSQYTITNRRLVGKNFYSKFSTAQGCRLLQ